MLGLTIGLRALRTAQSSLDVVGQNVANASTPGYARRLSDLRTTEPWMLGRLSFGTGVALDDLRRVHDSLLEMRLLEQRHALGRLDAAGGLLGQIESSLREPGANGISARLDELWNSFSELTSFPDDPALRASLLASAGSLGGSFRELAGRLAATGDQARQHAAGAVDVVNGLLRDLAAVNERVLQSRHAGASLADLADERDRLLQQLSEWVDPQVVERPDGTTDVLLDGILLVSGRGARLLATKARTDGTFDVVTADGRTTLAVGGGRLRGFLDVARLTVPQREGELDRVARELMLEINRIHTTSVSAMGPHTQLTSAVAVGPGQEDDALSTVGLPFAMSAGRLTVNVVESATGAITQHFVDVDPTRMSLNDLAAALDALPHLSSTVDPAGRLRVAASTGYGFDFSTRIDVDPDDAGSFGSDQATLTSGAGPFALSNGDTLTLSVNGAAPVVVTFNSGGFANIAQATAAEVAAIIEAQVGGVSAVAQDGRVVLQSDQAGATSSLQVVATTNPAVFAAGLSDSGATPAVAVALSGAPTAGHSGRFTVQALGDGVIGSTPGLQVALLDGAGATVATFDVGSGYVPGEPIELVPGVKLSLSAGAIQASANDLFEFDLVADSDTADALSSLQLGAFFTGSGAADMAVADDLAADPRAIAGSRSGAPTDGSGFLELLGLKDALLQGLDGKSVAQSYGEMVAGVGLDVSSNESATTSQTQLLASLEARREEISGVNTDEEMVKLLEYQHLYQAAGRFLQSVSQMTDVLFQLV
jgi:flagellar hook-associated protein FlgK